MPGDTDGTSHPTRRTYLRYGGGLVSGGLLAGCTSGDERSISNAGSASNTPTAAETSTPADRGYSATMAPMGEVEFDRVPRRVYTGLPNTADMAVAVGRGDALNSIYYPEYHGTLLNHFYDRLDDVALDWEGLTDAWNLGKEGFYELDSDVHLTDPAYASTLENLDRDDVEEIGDEIAPWFGNHYSDRRRDPPEGWADEYQYYSLWELFGRVARVFQASDRAEALAEVHDALLTRIEAEIPPETERPTVALTFKGEDESFWVYHLNAPGFLSAHTRPLRATDAFADAEFDGAQRQVDYEAMLAADPDVVLVLFTMASSYSIAEIRSGLESNAVASELSAVQDDRVYAQGARYQGPLMNLFQLEMTAKQLYPEQFGEWPGYVDGEPYPEIPEAERLFDRERVASIVAGEV